MNSLEESRLYAMTRGLSPEACVRVITDFETRRDRLKRFMSRPNDPPVSGAFAYAVLCQMVMLQSNSFLSLELADADLAAMEVQERTFARRAEEQG